MEGRLSSITIRLYWSLHHRSHTRTYITLQTHIYNILALHFGHLNQPTISKSKFSNYFNHKFLWAGNTFHCHEFDGSDEKCLKLTIRSENDDLNLLIFTFDVIHVIVSPQSMTRHHFCIKPDKNWMYLCFYLS